MTGDTTIENAPGSLNCDGERRCRCKVGYRSPRAVCVVSFTFKLPRYAVLNGFAQAPEGGELPKGELQEEQRDATKHQHDEVWKHEGTCDAHTHTHSYINLTHQSSC